MRWLFLFFGFLCCSLVLKAQVNLSDSVSAAKDSMLVESTDVSLEEISYSQLLAQNKWIKDLKAAQNDPVRWRHVKGPELLFYTLLIITVFFGVIKISFPRYFSNLFRVFFNTSLRQTQLADQLLQSSLPSMLFNILYFFTAGLFCFLILQPFVTSRGWLPITFYLICVLALAALYFIKYIWLIFFSWLTNLTRELNAYVFIVFLTNKMLGVLLLIFLPFLIFAEPWLAGIFHVMLSLLICLLFVIRFLKAYNLVRTQIQIGFLHFLVYLVALEILPVLVAGRLVYILLNKKL